ncbi:hypothetical protein GA0061083_0027 [Pseudarthrobacter enclensis]|uniref:hypothetical protein n=1 Tax=Pseudarthrobacter enclensis TaxID=993070 RepID=UPI0008159BF9|nr:hypothetical protein [Pseudarthrobacter enclensis]SCC29876.1 hypothetical protein GA0061083_0027 [Pseudarthrobacter enclensis]
MENTQSLDECEAGVWRGFLEAQGPERRTREREYKIPVPDEPTADNGYYVN